MINPLKNKRILFFAKITISVGLITYLIWIMEWDRAVKIVTESNMLLIAISPLFWLISLCVASVRWQLAFGNRKATFTYRQAFSWYLLGSFYDIFMPGVIGGDAVRIGLCAKITNSKITAAATSVLLERITGVFALLCFLISVAVLYPSILSLIVGVNYVSSITAIIIFALILLIILLLGYRFWLKWLPKPGSGRIWSFINSEINIFGTLREPTVATIILLSVLFQGIRITGMYILSRAIGLTVPFIAFFAIIPLVYLATLLPISLGGLGVREGTLVLLLRQLSVSISDATTLSFLIYLNLVIIGLLGGLLQLLLTFKKRKAETLHIQLAEEKR